MTATWLLPIPAPVVIQEEGTDTHILVVPAPSSFTDDEAAAGGDTLTLRTLMGVGK